MTEDQTGAEVNADAEQVQTGVDEAVMPTDEAGEPQVEQTTEQGPSAEVLGLQKARDDKAARAREAEEQNAYLRGQLEAMQAQQAPADQFEGRDPYETVTVEDLRQFKEDHQKTLEQERMYQDQYQRKQRIDSSIDRAKGSYADFDEMYEYAKKVYTPEELGAIGATKDPGDLVYRMVKARPEIQAKESTTQKATTVEKTVAAINERMNSSGTLSDVGGSDRLLDQVKKWDQMNPNSQDFDDELERVKRLPKLGE